MCKWFRKAERGQVGSRGREVMEMSAPSKAVVLDHGMCRVAKGVDGMDVESNERGAALDACLLGIKDSGVSSPSLQHAQKAIAAAAQTAASR